MIRFLLLVAVLLSAGCSTPASLPPVVIIGVDGMSPDGIRNADTPVLDSLMASGAWSMSARGVFPTSSSPNWKSMISGAGPEQHGVTSNAWEADRHLLLPTIGAEAGSLFPTIFDLVREQAPSARVASIYDWGGFGRLYNKAAVTDDVDADGPEDAVASAADMITSGQPALMFIHLDHVDGAGHGQGHGSPAYYEAVERADQLIGNVVEALRAAGTLEETTIMISSDHGGVGTGHGGETMAELEIPWIVSGPNVKRGHELSTPIDTWDTAATAAGIMGLDMPLAWRGKIVSEALKEDGSSADVQPGMDGVDHVLVIGVDGMSPDGIRRADTPVLDSIMAEGAWSMNARSVLTSSSSQNWASMVMGAGPEQHGITSNGWERDDVVTEPTRTGHEGLFPGMFSVLRDEEPNAALVAVYDWGGFGRLIPGSILQVDVDGDGPLATTESAIASFSELQPRLTFVHLDHVDHAGHAEGHGSVAYYDSVEKADEYIGMMMAGLRSSGMAKTTLVIITSDHGGLGTGHGGESMAEMEIPWIVTGPGVKTGHRLSAPIDQYDTAAMALHALGIEQPASWIGRPVLSAIEGNPDPARPVPFFPGSPRIEPLGGYFRDGVPVVTLSGGEDDAVYHYTMDGTNPTTDSPRYEGPFDLAESGILTVAAYVDGAFGGASSALFRVVDEDAEANIAYAYYEGSWGGMLPDFDALTPVSTGNAFEIHVDELQGRREDAFGAVFTGTIRVEEPGSWDFYTTSDDGSKLYVNGQQVVDNDGDHGAVTKGGSISLEPGLHEIRVEYFENGGGETLTVAFRPPGGEVELLSWNHFEAGR